MKVLFNTYPTAFQFPGGGELILQKMHSHLRKKGIDVKLFDQWNDRIPDFDVLHNFGVVGSTEAVVRSAKESNVPVAVHTIYWPMNEFALRGSLPLKERMKKLAYNFSNRHNFFGISKMRNILDMADALCPNSETEAKMLIGEFGVERERIHVIHDGVDSRFYDAKPDAFVKKYKLKDFVLYVGRIEPRRNLLGLIKAMRNIDAPLVVIGSKDPTQEAYCQECMRLKTANTHFLGRLDHESELLESAYAASKVFVAPTWAETPGLAAMEAGMARSNIVITTRGCAREYFRDYATYIDPTNQRQIETAIRSALQKERSSALAKHMLKNYSWESVADEAIACYTKISKK